MTIRGQESNETAAPATTMGTAFAAARPAAAPAPAAPQARAAAQPAQPGVTQRGGAFSFRNLGSLVNSPMGRTPASEVLTKLTKSLQDVYENTNKTFEVSLIPIDMNNTSVLNVSVLVVAMREIANKEAGVAYHTLILEGSVEPIAPRFEQINGQNVEIVRTVGEANDNRLAEVVGEAVARQFPQSKLLNADAEVVPRDFDITDSALVYALAANAAYACATEIDTRRSDFIDMNLANASKDENLTVRTAFVKTPIINAVGQPVRSDITVDLSAVAANQQANAQQLERVSPVSRISGFLDLVWDPVAPSVNPYTPYQAPNAAPQSFQKYATRFVMTSMETLAALTLPAQLLTLVTALSLRENNSWAQAFRPAAFQGGVDMHDIGAIGIEANFEGNPTGYGSPIDTKADSFKPDSLAKLIAAVIKPGLILSLDVEECGPSTWFNGVFAAAAAGHPKANDMILDAANYLTNGQFSKYFPQNGRVAIDENNRIHLGYYTDAQGIKRDIRDIDYLAVLNLVGGKDPEVVRDWSDTFQRIEFPIAQRLAARKRILTGLFSDVTITGFGRRVSFDSQFTDALAKGCADCGLDVRAVQPYADMSSYERATARFTGETLMGAQATGLFNRGFSGVQGGASVGANRQFGGGRWY